MKLCALCKVSKLGTGVSGIQSGLCDLFILCATLPPKMTGTFWNGSVGPCASERSLENCEMEWKKQTVLI
jgi:hypothetical protein